MKAWVVPLIALCCSASLDAATLALTEGERAWIRDHPVVEYAVDPYWPIEYVENGQHQGLTRDYIDHIQRTTGLRLVRVPSPDWQTTQQALASGRLMLASAVSERLLDAQPRSQLLLSQPYFFGATVAITRAGKPMLFTASRLTGQTVAVKGGGGYEHYLRQHHPGVRLLLLGDAEQALAAVAEQRADVAIGLDVVLQPVLRRKYAGRLHLAGVVADMPVVLAMGVTPSEPLLRAIVDKALGSLTSKATDDIYDRWLAQTDFGAPTWQTLAQYYWLEIVAGLGLLLLLATLVRLARVAQRRAQRSERRMARFLAMLGHEIRTPMNAVLSAIELLSRSQLGVREQQWVSLANDSAVNLLELLDDILEITRLDAGAVQLHLQPTDVAALGRSVAELYRLEAERKGLTLDYRALGFDHRLLRIDRLRVRQILTNLLSNAVKFTHHGQVSLALECRPTASGAGGWLEIRVSDSGVGIAPDRHNAVFEAFTQANGSTTERYGGSGLGLAICRELIQLMGGSIALRSEVGNGTEISCRLPVALQASPPTLAAASPPASAETSVALRKTVLVVEDHVLNQRVIVQQLDMLGYRCEVVGSATQALRAISVHHGLGLVLLDCQLPDLDGYALARKIRQMPGSHGHVPIVAISAASDPEHVQRCYASGMNDVLLKPLQLSALTRVCGQFLRVAERSVGSLAPALDAATRRTLEQLLVTTCRDDLRELTQALHEQRLQAAVGLAHRMEGAARMAGALPLAEAAERLQQRLEAGPLPRDDWQPWVDEVYRALEDVEKLPSP
ncbi:transporter substrate-binding domain-containing protein [Pseudomonas sp. CFBP 8770]|uniref:ATP-binding protein n=1 Tax=unclassified Pseudomonas TaxID=196821 RepID=UPI001780C61F|nr:MULTISPECIES: ATP-binding protein [unclassified Pseudomonas]MBD8474981.1 transporter substrate-binding domain-containing protein [Pseudomonas sp. CFBP 8773]MBD8648110.1 transporter substrate-binding domain-containing protein [Pseudomonas sp. CFBP 8770]